MDSNEKSNDQLLKEILGELKQLKMEVHSMYMFLSNDSRSKAQQLNQIHNYQTRDERMRYLIDLRVKEKLDHCDF